MRNFGQLKDRYRNDAAFNKMVNLFRQLIEEYQFIPSEIREGLFLAQYLYESDSVREILRSQQDFEKIEAARELLRDAFFKAEEVLK